MSYPVSNNGEKPHETGETGAELPGSEPKGERNRRKLPWILLLTFIVGLGAVAVGFIAATEKGLQWAFSILARNIPGELQVDHLAGRLIGPLSLRGLRYTTAKKNITLSIEKLEADISPLALLYERIHISRLDITGVSYTQLPSAEPPTEPPDIQLPLGITLDQASITRLTVNLPALNQVYPVDRITLTGKTLRGRLHIDALNVVSNSFQARARGTLKPRNDYPLSLVINWSASPQNYPAVIGQTTLTGNLVKDLNISQSINTPLRATLNGIVKNMFTAMQWQANLAVDKTNINSINKSWPVIEMGGKLRLTAQAHDNGKSSRIIAEGSLQSTHQKYTLNTTARANFSDNKWYLEQATLALPDSPARIILKGTLGEGLIPALSQSDHPWYLTGRWYELAWPPKATPGAAIIASKEGSFSVAGNLDAYQFTADGVVQGRASAKGSTSAARGRTPETASMSGATLPSVHWTATGIGDRESLIVDEMQADILQGHLAAQGELRWPQSHPSSPQKSSPLSWSVDITGSDLNPGQQWPAWPGQLDFQARIHNAESSTESTSAITLDISELKGHIRDVPLNGNALLVIDKDSYTIPHLTLASGSSHLSASGTLNETWNVQGEMDIHNLSEIMPAALLKHSGTLQGKGLLTGPREQPHINAELQGKNLTMGETYKVGDVRLLVDVDTQNQLPSQLDLIANDIIIGNQLIDNIVVKGRGQAQNHVIDATLKASEKTLVFRAEGALGPDISALNNGTQTDTPLWTGHLTQANMTSTALGNWPLTTPGVLAITTDHAQLGPWCWTQQAAQICMDASRAEKTGWQVNTHTTNLPMNWFQPFLPPQTIVAGTFNATATAYLSTTGVVTGAAKLIPSAGTMVQRLADDQDLVLAYTQGLAEATLDADALNARAALTLTDRGTLDGTLQLPRSALPAFLNSPTTQPSPPGSVPIKAKLNAEIRELSVLPDFFPEIEDTQGKVSIALSVEGTVDKPRFSGYAKLEQGTALVPRLGLRLRDIQIQATGTNTDPQGRAPAKGSAEATDTNEGQLSLTAQARSGDGILHLRGTLRPGTRQNWGADLTVQGENFEAMRTPDIQATASPNLTIKIAENTVNVNGDLAIPTAHIELRDLTTTVRPSSDVIIVRRGQKIRGNNINDGADNQEIINNKRWMINSAIGLKLGGNITFKGVGLTGRFTGNLALIDTPQQVTTAYGEIRIEEGGEYRAVNQKLEVKKGGRLVFAGGPLNNPGIDARATRQVTTNIRVGFNVRGTLQSPQLSVYSEPSMTETDALAYLLFGGPMSQATTAQGGQMAQAASSLGAAGGEFLMKKIGNTFGIEDVRIETAKVNSTSGTLTNAQQATVVLGKYLSPKLYISYGVGTVDRINTLRLRYQLSRRWTVETETSELRQGTDILYTIDKK